MLTSILKYKGLLRTCSVKTNFGTDLVAPQTYGQLTKKKFIEKFGVVPTHEEDLDDFIKRHIYENFKEMMPKYLTGLTCCDFTLYIKTKGSKKSGMIEFQYISLFYTKRLEHFHFDSDKLSLSNNTYNWFSTNTDAPCRSNYLYHDGTKIGYFQIHTSRDCVKFRFYLSDFLEVVAS